ncbi:hypothetical protein J4476_01965 [Candidatus Woesearchaeota archaeon]|nr:hypothetical protein [Candidatus Woesearchaeota archaeon]HIH26143.1 hypothetical protein [Nanoarchaeota archaeon]
MEYSTQNNSYNTSSSNTYNINSSYSNQKRRSKCPRGATLGEIGSCCGLQCTRACAAEN